MMKLFVDDYWEENLGIYSEDTREDLVESGALSAEEDAFMKGYEEAS